MNAFDKAIKRMAEINIPADWKPMFVSVMQKFSKTFANLDGLDIDLDKLFEEKLYNNLKICEYNDSFENFTNGEHGRYDYEKNTIYLLNSKCADYFCHEFTHFIMHNLYPQQFAEIGGPEIPLWLDEVMTQRVTNYVMNTPNNSSYRNLLNLTSFVERNIEDSFSVVDFLNGEMPKLLKLHNLKQFEKDLNHFTHHNTEDSGYASRSKIISYYYDQFINKQLLNENIGLKQLLTRLAEYETQDLKNGKTNPFTIETVAHCLKSEERDKLFNAQSPSTPNLLQKFIFSKNIRAYLTKEQSNQTEIFIQNYLSFLRKQIFIENGGNRSFEKEEIEAAKNLPKINQMLNEVCHKTILEENKEKEKISLNSFLEKSDYLWLSQNNEGFLKNVKHLNQFAELFESQLFLTKAKKSMIVGNAFWLKPLYEEKSEIVKKLGKIKIENLQSFAQSLEHGEQCNILIDVKNKLVPAGNLAVAAEDLGVSVNWKGMWQYLPKEVQLQIQNSLFKNIKTPNKELFK